MALPNEERGGLGRPWDPRAFIAIISVIGAIAIQIYILADVDDLHSMPNWIVALVSSTTSYYFGAKNGSGYKKDPPA